MPYLIDLIPIRMENVYVIVGMDWMSRFGVTIDCEGERVVVRTTSGGELVIYGEGTRIGYCFSRMPGLDNIFTMVVWVIFPMWFTHRLGSRHRFKMSQSLGSLMMCFRRSYLVCLPGGRLSSGLT